MADEELWHVRLSPDEVKVLTLDQLDDLFRLEVIEADALVWQPGMDEWLPLNVVAGLGDEDDDGSAVSIPVSEPPRPPAPRVGATTAVGWPPAPGTAHSQRPAPPPLSQRPLPPAPVKAHSQRPAPPAPVAHSQRPAPPPLSQRPAPPAAVALSQRPAPPPLSQRPLPPAPGTPHSQRPAPPPLSQRPLPPAPQARGSARAPQSWVDPRPVANVSPFGATTPAHAFPPYAEASPGPQVTEISLRPRARARSGGTFVIALAIAAGAAVTLYRNAVVHAAAQSMGQEKSYLALETALGGPSFGTPRAVDRMTEATRSLLDRVAQAAPPAPPSRPAPKEEPEPTQAPEPDAQPAKAAAPVAASPSPRRAAASPVVRTSSRSEPDPLMQTQKKGKKAGKGSEFDPLNGNL